MKKTLFLLLISFSCINTFSQNCNGISCIANPSILQEELIICYADSDTMQFNYCSEETCNKVCELTEFTYTTAYHNGSSFIWTVIGGQLTSVSPSGNTITIFWDSTGSGSVSVTEQDTLMCSESSTICIDIIPKPLPTIITLANSDTICYGSPIYFQGVDLNNSTITQVNGCDSNQTVPVSDTTQFAYELQYFWDFGDGSTSTDQNPTHVFGSSGSYSVSLTISNSCQCSDVATTDIVVINTPGPSITTCVGPLCEGDTSEYCTDAILPNWDVIGGTLYNTLSSDNCIAIIWDNQNNELDDGAGELLVGDLNSSCGQSQSFYSVPIVPLNPIITGNIIACPGAMESYSFECIPGIDYYWSISGGWGGTILSGTNTSEILVAFDQWAWNTSFQITLDMSSTTLACTPAPVTINVDVLPPINGIYVSSDVCEDAIVNYSDWSGSQYNWTVINGSIISSTPSSQIDVIWDQGPGNGMIITELINSGVYCQTSQSYPVNIVEIPSAAINILGDSLICPGETYIYYVEESNASSSENLGYNWVVTGGTSSVSIGDVTTITWDPSGPYSIDVTNQILQWPSCTSPTFTKSISVAVSPSPVISGSNTACLNSVSSFDLSTLYPSWAVISWSVSNPILGSVVSGQGTAQAQVEWGNQIGLGSTDVVVEADVCGVIYSSSFTVTFNNQPISFSITNNPICSESALTFTSTAGVGDYYWGFGDGTNSTQALPLKTYNEPGSYLVSLTFTDLLTQCVTSYSSVISVQGIAGSLLPEGTSFFCSSSIINQPLSISTISQVTPAIEWFHNGVSVSTSNTYTVSSSPPNHTGIGSYSVVLTGANGCSNTLNVITIDTLDCSNGSGWCSGGGGCPPLVPLVYTSVCNSGLGTMSFDFSSPNGSTVDWRVDNGPISSALSYAITFDESGVYNVKASSGCLLGIEQITVPLVVDLDYSVICDPLIGNQITYYFEDNSSYLLGYGTATYNWDFGDGTPASNLQNPSHLYASNGTYNVDFTVTYGTYSCNKTTTITVTDFNANYSYIGLECENIPTITFTASTFNIVSWTWDFGDGGSSDREIPRRTYIQSGTFTTSLQITDISGCTATATNPLTIESNPIITSVNNLGPFCSNDLPIDLSSEVSFNITNGEIASWSGIGIDYDPITQIYSFNPMLAGGGSHEICVTITDNNGCYDKKCVMIDVLCPEKPIIFGESEYCYNYSNWNSGDISLYTQSIYNTYQWYKNGVGMVLAWSYVWDNVGVGTYDYMVEVIDDNGCTVFSEPFTLNMNISPNIVSVSTNINACPNEEIILSHNGNQSGVDYYWNTLPQQTAPTVTVTAIADYEYTVTAINEFGCKSVSYPIVIPSEIPLCGVLSGCLCDDEIMNSAGLINITGLNNSWQYSNYEWLLNGISFSPAQNASSLIIDPLDPNYLTICAGAITLAVTDNNGCLSASNPLTIEPNCNSCFTTNPNYNISQIICAGESLVFGSNTYSTPGIYINNLQASNGCDSNVILNLTVLPLLTSMQNVIMCLGDSINIGSNIYYSDGNYTDTLNNVVGCDSVIMTQITISEPLVNLSLVSSLLTVQVTGGAVPYYYEFGNQDGILLTSFNNFGSTISFNPLVNGIYYFFIIDDNNCVSDTVFYLVDIFPTLIDEFGVSSLNIFPNPSKDRFSIAFTSEDSQDLKVRIFNLIGEQIINEDLQQFVGEYAKQIDLTENAKGIYFLEITTNNGVINKKLILQ